MSERDNRVKAFEKLMVDSTSPGNSCGSVLPHSASGADCRFPQGK